ncbi:MAG: hypothetical protein LH478_05815 [Chitinophagaceae bacterium]|nr:hypothetical protein [Chitinophagaceae bacterium]
MIIVFVVYITQYSLLYFDGISIFETIFPEIGVIAGAKRRITVLVLIAAMPWDVFALAG